MASTEEAVQKVQDNKLGNKRGTKEEKTKRQGQVTGRERGEGRAMTTLGGKREGEGTPKQNKTEQEIQQEEIAEIANQGKNYKRQEGRCFQFPVHPLPLPPLRSGEASHSLHHSYFRSRVGFCCSCCTSVVHVRILVKGVLRHEIVTARDEEKSVISR